MQANDIIMALAVQIAETMAERDQARVAAAKAQERVKELEAETTKEVDQE